MQLVDSCDPQERHLAEAAIKKIEEYQTSLFNGLLDREKYERKKNSGEIRFSHKANQVSSRVHTDNTQLVSSAFQGSHRTHHILPLESFI